MDNSKATVTLYHDTRRAKKEDKFPVKLNIYFDAEKKRFKTGIDLTEADWKRLNGANLRDDQLKIAKRKLNGLVKKAESVISNLETFSFQEFQALFFEEKKMRSSKLQELFDEYIALLNSNDQIGTAISYKTTLNSIKKYKSGLKVGDITKDFLIGYEKHMISDGLSPSTAGIYLRQLRRIINVAIAKGMLSPQKYPFKGYAIPSSRNIKKSLKAEQLKALFSFQTEDSKIRKALDFWLFSYLSNGINMGDVCFLKPTNIDGDFFSFFRAKTKNTKKKDLRAIKVPLTELSKEIIEKWRTRDVNNPYLFPILEGGLTAKQAKYRIQDFIYFVNKHMKTVANELGIKEKVGTYVARHSHSTILKRAGVPTELIKENLGHSSVLITEAYLDDFTDDVKLDYAKILTDL